MSTGTALFTRALRMLGAVNSGGTPTANEFADCLTAFNSLLESWRNDRLLVYATLESTLTMVSSQQTYTVGIGGDLNITRPISFDDAFMRVSGVDTGVQMIEQPEWDALGMKTSTSTLIEKIFYNATMTGSLGTLKVYPVPSAANELHLISWIVLDSLSAYTDTVTFPPGYDRMCASNLAIEMAPEFRIEPSTTLMKIARDSMAAIKAINARPINAVSELAAIMNTKTAGSRILLGP